MKAADGTLLPGVERLTSQCWADMQCSSGPASGLERPACYPDFPVPKDSGIPYLVDLLWQNSQMAPKTNATEPPVAPVSFFGTHLNVLLLVADLALKGTGETKRSK